MTAAFGGRLQVLSCSVTMQPSLPPSLRNRLQLELYAQRGAGDRFLVKAIPMPATERVSLTDLGLDLPAASTTEFAIELEYRPHVVGASVTHTGWVSGLLLVFFVTLRRARRRFLRLSLALAIVLTVSLSCSRAGFRSSSEMALQLAPTADIELKAAQAAERLVVVGDRLVSPTVRIDF